MTALTNKARRHFFEFLRLNLPPAPKISGQQITKALSDQHYRRAMLAEASFSAQALPHPTRAPYSAPAASPSQSAATCNTDARAYLLTTIMVKDAMVKGVMVKAINGVWRRMSAVSARRRKIAHALTSDVDQLSLSMAGTDAASSPTQPHSSCPNRPNKRRLFPWYAPWFSMIIVPNLILIISNLVLLTPFVLYPEKLSADALLLTASAVRVCCNYVMPLLCGGILGFVAVKNRLSSAWCVIGLLLLASNSCWLVFDARVPAVGHFGTLKACTNLTSTSPRWFLLYMLLTLVFYLLERRRARPSLNVIEASSTEVPLQMDWHDQSERPIDHDDCFVRETDPFLVNRWRY